jgi:ribosomal protein L37AE/L43A
MAKLQNIKAIKQMLDGSHRTQNKTVVGYEGEVEKKREIGERWIDDNGKEWEQRKGFKISVNKFLDEIAEMRMPSNCPKCNKEMNHRFDKKFWNLEKHCFDCQVAYEHDLRIDGKYEEYEKRRILANALAWLKDAEKEAQEIIDGFRNPATFANSDGTVEKWQHNISPEEVADKIEKEFEEFKTNFIQKLEDDLNLS